MKKLTGTELRDLRLLCRKYNCNFVDTLNLVEGDNSNFAKSSEEDNFFKILLESDTPRKKLTQEERDIQRFLEQIRLGYLDSALEILNKLYRKDMRRKRRR